MVVVLVATLAIPILWPVDLEGTYNALTFTPKRFCTSAMAFVYVCIYLQQRIHVYLLQQRTHAPSITKECAYGHFILIRICKYHITFLYAYTHVYTHFWAKSLRAEPAKRAKRHNTNIHQRVIKKKLRYIYPHPYSFPRSGYDGGNGKSGFSGGGGGSQSRGGAGGIACSITGSPGTSFAGGSANSAYFPPGFGGGIMKYYCACIAYFFIFLLLAMCSKKMIFLRINIFHVCIFIGAGGGHGGIFFIIFFLNRLSLKMHPH